MQNFNYLPLNKTVVFESKIDTVNDLCRTGTINTNPIDSFINSVLYAFSKKFILTRDECDKINQINELKSFIFSKIEESDSFTHFRDNVSSKFIEYLDIIYSYIESLNYDNGDQFLIPDEINDIINKINDNSELYNIINEMISFDNFQKILKRLKKKWSDYKINTFREIILSEIMTFINYEDLLENVDESKSEFIKNSITYFIELIINKINIPEPYIPSFLSLDILNIVSNHFKCDIYFIDSSTRLPIVLFNDYKTNDNISIILLSFDNNHFETIGKLNSNKRIQRQFHSYDEIIKFINFHNKKN